MQPMWETVPKATCEFAPSGGRKAERARPSRRACAIAPRRSVHDGSNSGHRPTSRSRDPECERVLEHEVFLTVMYRCTAEPSVHAYLPCSGHPPEHGHAIFHVQVIHLNIHLRTFNVQQCCCTWIMKRFTIHRIGKIPTVSNFSIFGRLCKAHTCIAARRGGGSAHRVQVRWRVSEACSHGVINWPLLWEIASDTTPASWNLN